jgi:hypothetical protein
MTCGLESDGHPASTEYDEYFEKDLAFIKNNLLIIKVTAEYSSAANAAPAPTMMVRIGEDSPDSKAFSLIESSLEKWSPSRLFCTTIKGRLASVAPNSRNGDLICLLYGGEVPYILRPRSLGGYNLVGECYIDGFMHGKALSDSGIRARDFRLF